MIHFENRDCMDALKEFPDGFFDLAIVDPPYGDGNRTNTVASGGVLAEVRRQVRQVQGTCNERTCENRTDHGVIRTGGTWATKYAKKLFRGTLRRGRSISRSCSASHGIR